ncbi:phosphoribosylformylglycinamidine synthase subunit PurQ [Zavarzinia compransoris]|uniref:phosphoribosylformylglycinamidine synthase subunit PurQ n=1 Tax=Zavarzinia marina TaxID=2911065 RepID=UPI001F400AA9|nr:phosphoribosylformylglycinamidine synthase subunit PurQ [Zavarzinia marina]MCF4164343.1 phosphoribosylformylglycinamidine synthase subunit PurQ [Zavarzinia marina]
MKAAVVVFPGSNRERDIALALQRASYTRPVYVWHGETELPAGTDLVVLPGGFSHGDYLRCGAMAALSPIMDAVKAHAARGGYVLGVCNGFQILAEARLVPGVLMRNASLRFVCRDVHLKVEATDTAFTGGFKPGQVVRVPVAHAEGNYFTDDETLNRIEGEGQVAFRYCDADGAVTEAASPNGSARNIAGVFNAGRNVLGMMPHPENMTEDVVGGTDGAILFDSLAKALA